MIKPENFERALHEWKPWIEAIEHARSKSQFIGQDSDTWWEYAKKLLLSLGLPGKQLLRLYFLSCVFSQYIEGKGYIYNNIELPPFLYDKLYSMGNVLRNSFCHCILIKDDDIIVGAYGVYPYSQTHIIGDSIRYRPLPPVVWNRRDVIYKLKTIPPWMPGIAFVKGKLDISNINQLSKNQLSKPVTSFEVIQILYSPCLIVLTPNHPLVKIGSKIKRKIDDELAIRCAKMKDEEGLTYQQIGKIKGWQLQKDEYDKETRCPKALRYVKRGRELLE